MSTPVFSVLTPTKNRSHLVGYAIESTLAQTFGDLEVVVVDNDDSDDTRRVVVSFGDSRVKYYRTGGLNMSENWEFALDQATGEYVTVLEDKQVYYPDALQRISDAMNETACDIVVWEWDIYREQTLTAYRKRYSDRTTVMSTEDILAMYTSSPTKANRFLPRMLNSCAPNRVIKEIREHGNVKRFFAKLSPDLCAAFYLLAFNEKLCFLNNGLGLVGHVGLSNARQMRAKGESAYEYYGKSIMSDYALEHVPVKEFLTYNTVYEDYLRIREEIGGRLSSYVMSPSVYATMCFWELAKACGHGSGLRGVPKGMSPILRYLSKERLSVRDYVNLLRFPFWSLGEVLSRKVVRLGARRWNGDNIYLAASQVHVHQS